MGVEFLLAVAGIGHLIIGTERAGHEALFLLGWNLVALPYLLVGMIVVRRRVMRDEPDDPVTRRPRFAFVLTVAASLTGLGAALNVLVGFGGDLAPVITGLSVTTVLTSWLLLHVGYARFYATWDSTRDRSGFTFPDTDVPRYSDYLYFALTVGVAFATSDVTVRHRQLRWHVTVHSVVSFLYNAIVLAVGVGVLTTGTVSS